MQTGHQTTPVTSGHMGSVAKVYIIRSGKTVAQLRDADIAQQNPRGRDRDALHRYFEAALAKFRAPVRVMLPSSALGCHKLDGISLGIFGSYPTYPRPRFLEVPACLSTMTPTGDTLGNDNGECDTMRGACFVGQGAFLQEVGHAFGAGHTTGIMARGYSKA
ncbi:putative peptidase family-domain-containing protein [Aspergillus pseudotamarii]|uniref:Putative peptidase family-domain-containing protein n=1 Tax=Aspergillus pseudotamarii TaxID=132259 RepID=A0A5N6ST21_ASPPS|nr:putative peptidase family-domain-containing protein [Aspergillus pseudotamarii]KAE8137828.1 putative peptidase family-domain-containing protein [Aspergillus pseudotamarii]